MCLSRPRRITGLCCVCAVVCLVTAPASAQTVAPVPGAVPGAAPAAALPPVQAVKEALDRAGRAKNLGELNGSLTGESAAGIGLSLILMDSMVSGLTGVMAPKTATHTKASEKAFQDKVVALLGRYSLNQKTVAAVGRFGALPPGLALRGHQLLADALALDDAYEKTHPSKEGGTLGSQMGGDKLPASSACDFQVLSATRVKIVPRRAPKSSIEARLENGQWRLDIMDAAAPPSPARTVPRFKPLTPKAAAFLLSIDDEDLEAVRQQLKADPALANTPPGYFHGHSGSISDTPLALAAFKDDPKTAALLLQSGAAVNADDGFGSTALDRASRLGHADVVAVLLGHGADTAHRDNSGETALHLAAEGDDLATVTLLLAHGAKINARDHDGKTSLGLALGLTSPSADHSAILDLLRRHGAKK